MQPTETGELVTRVLSQYRDLTISTLLRDLPTSRAAYLYDLVPDYPSRPGKGLRAALCLATCAALGGDVEKAVNAAVTIELFHNAFLIHDDIQDESESRRGAPTLPAEYGVGVALNVGNATNLLALDRLAANRRQLGPRLAWRIFEETQLMLRHSLEGQAIEIGWIRDNVCDLDDDDYLRMCLKKTSWYTCVYPCRIGALIATGESRAGHDFDRFGWYLGAAFQIQDDILNLVGDYEQYGKEISGDLWEGKRTLMLIRFLQTCTAEERARVRDHLARLRRERDPEQVRWLLDRLTAPDCLEPVLACARELASAARIEGSTALAGTPDSDDKRFLLELPDYVIRRDR